MTPPASPLATRIQAAAAALIGRRIVAVTYHGLMIGERADSAAWDFDT